VYWDEGIGRAMISRFLIKNLHASSMRIRAWIFLLCLIVPSGLTQTAITPNPLQTGHVLNVVCASDATQSYALYLPSTYTPSKRWPIVYFFDPGGRGARPLELYKDVAEKYGFIFAGSNNSRNFGSEESKAVNSIWLDTHSRLALDEHRIYTSGFSGGARVAGAMALSCDPCQIVGVIAHGAGYPNSKSEAKNRLLYYFAVGNEDFNWPEVITIRKEREDRGIPYRVYEYPGKHQWAPPEVMEDAVEWTILRSMQSGGMPPDAAFVDRMFSARQQEAEAAEKKQDAIAQLSAYRSLVSDFLSLKDTSEWGRKLTVLKTSSALKSALKREQEQIAEQLRIESAISPKLHAYVEGQEPDPIQARIEIVQAMAGLKNQAAHAKDEAKRLVLSRAMTDVWVDGIETGQQELESRHFDKAESCFQLMSQVNDDPWPVLLLAETHASMGNKELAIKDLQEVVRRGLKDAEVFASDAKLQVLKADPEFQKLLQGLKP